MIQWMGLYCPLLRCETGKTVPLSPFGDLPYPPGKIFFCWISLHLRGFLLPPLLECRSPAPPQAARGLTGQFHVGD